VVCPDEKAAVAHITQRIEGQNRLCGKQTLRSEGSKRILQLRYGSPSESVEGILCSADLFPHWGRPMLCGKKRLNAPQRQPGYGF